MKHHDASRRRFLRVTMVGAAAAVAGPVIVTPAAAFATTEAEEERFLGQIKIGALFRGYLGAPLGLKGTTSWEITNSRTDTFKLSSEVNVEVLVFDVSVKHDFFGFGGPVFEEEFRVGRSNKESASLAIAQVDTERYGTLATGPDGYNTVDDTVFVFQSNPVFNIFQLYRDGQKVPGTVRYELVSLGRTNVVPALYLRTNQSLRQEIGPLTADSMLAQYPLFEDPSAVALGLGEPRFVLRREIYVPGGTFGFSRSIQGTTTFSVEQTAKETVVIKEGFESEDFGSFKTGVTLEVTVSGVQEAAASAKLTVSATDLTGSFNVHRIYEDTVYNTFLISDEGPPTATVVAGTVTAADGQPVPGAVLLLLVDGVEYMTVANRAGRYVLRTAVPVKPGRYPLTCRGVTKTVTVGKSPARADYALGGSRA